MRSASCSASVISPSVAFSPMVTVVTSSGFVRARTSSAQSHANLASSSETAATIPI